MIQRIEVCVQHLSPDLREELLDVVWRELRISPGMVSADGKFELLLTRCDEPPEDAPIVRIGGALFTRVTPARLVDLLKRRK
ncbi:NAD(P)H-dependent oxidoreductase subunit E [Deinococcus yavapaiensis]|uniref:Thioredoxin-like protein n=1 Tax=Deinococcus yavapaiensis KR-236 TaxID=694435 RepID=A0A318SNC5_9DEIO|nr:NAD(P)H-dependent oxidoreductase subunit E [Deinococcus yavapaiensis]PYE56402.1 thioredoxin-like protein [Deinococcus yavapaiensis KR-236]